MGTYTHTFRIGVNAGANMQNVTNQIMGNLKKNMEEETGNFTEFVTKQAMYMAKLETQRFRFRGDLEKGIAHRYFKKTNKGEVFIKSDQIKIAIMNEFGTEPRFVPMNSKLREWAEMKAPHLAGRKGIMIGGKGGGSHVISPNPLNRFWGITVEKVNRDIDNMFAHYIEKILEKS